MIYNIIIGILLVLCFSLFVLLLLLQKSIYKHKKEQTLLKNQSKFKEQTANLIVHDLKVPLATLMNVELIQDEKIRLKMVKQASKRMMILVQNVLDTYKHENSTVKLKKEAVDMNLLIEEIVEEFKLMAEIKNLSFIIKKAGDPMVIADKDLINRVITNILSNSIKFSPPKGKIEIRITTENKKQIIKFFNEGPGIPKNKQTLIFNRFEQSQIENFGRLPSTGLGLNFCQIALKAHKGEIGVISNSDRGVEFWFSLPQ